MNGLIGSTYYSVYDDISSPASLCPAARARRIPLEWHAQETVAPERVHAAIGRADRLTRSFFFHLRVHRIKGTCTARRRFVCIISIKQSVRACLLGSEGGRGGARSIEIFLIGQARTTRPCTNAHGTAWEARDRIDECANAATRRRNTPHISVPLAAACACRTVCQPVPSSVGRSIHSA